MNEDTLQKQKQLQEQQQVQQQVQQEEQLQAGQLQQQASPVQTTIQQVPQTMQQHVNVQQTVQMQQQAQRVEVDFGPPDDAQPVPTEIPKRSWKQQRRHNKVMKQVSEDIKEETRTFETVATDEIKEMNEHVEPVRRLDLVWPYLKEFKVDKNGKPRTKADAEALEQNRTFMKDYLSTDKDKHNETLRKITADFLAQKTDPRCFDDPEEVMKHYIEYRHTLNVTMHFIDVMKMNPDYFANLDQQTKAAIEKQNRLYGDGEFNILAAVARMYGMAPDTGRLDGKDDPDTAGFFQQSKNSFKQANIREKVNPMLDKYNADVKKDFANIDYTGMAGGQMNKKYYSRAEMNHFSMTDASWNKVKDRADQHPGAKEAYEAYRQAREAFNEVLTRYGTLNATRTALEHEKDADGRVDPLTQLSLETLGRQIKSLEKERKIAGEDAIDKAERCYGQTRLFQNESNS